MKSFCPLLLVLPMFFSSGCKLVTVVDASLLNPVQHWRNAPPESIAKHGRLLVADLHADTLMLDRGGAKGIQRRHGYGHADAPRLREGNVGLQVLTVATHTPVIYSQALNSGVPLPNSQWLLSSLQGWPLRTWFDTRHHALHQAWKWRLNSSEGLKPGTQPPFTPIRTQGDLETYLQQHYQKSKVGWMPRFAQKQPIATVLGLEGSHALQLKSSDTDECVALRVREFRQAGFRMLALTHRFDNELAGASEGRRQYGVTALGERVLREMQNQGLICDLSHASGCTIDYVLDHYPELPVMVSHGGIMFPQATTPKVHDRLLTLEQARRIAQRGGVIGIGLWPMAVGGAEPSLTAKMIRDCIADPYIGREHVALGSDMDGAVKSAFAADDWALLTHELGGLDDGTLHDVMGGNVIRFFLRHLPVR